MEKNRQKIERLIREDLKQHKALKKKPKGDFVKLLITHTGWNAAEVRSIIREPSVCKAHPNPTDAERIWVCERNVPPIGSWLLNYTAMEDEDLDANKRHALEVWDKLTGGETSDATCGCFSAVVNPGKEDTWKGHICTTNVLKFRSPLVRALLRKGHAFKLNQGEETLLLELCKGLDGYIDYKTKREGDPSEYEAWKQAICTRVREKLGRVDSTLYPSGGMGYKEITELQKHLVFLKEDRAPHVVVGMCKHRYMLERDRYLYQGSTFTEDTEGEETILKRHRDFHENRGLRSNNRIPYIYGIWKSAKRNLRWISGVRRNKTETKGDSKPDGSIAGTGSELVGLLTQIMHALKRKCGDGRRKGKPKRCWFVESVEEVAQPLRFDAHEVAKHKATANTVDFVTMYPSFNQDLLKSRLHDSIEEAWAWEEATMKEGEELRVRKDGWVHLTKEEATRPSLGNWTKVELLELVDFVIDNGYIRRGPLILRQVMGFGMGLACAGQIANLGCYPVERDYADSRAPKEVEHNYRFIDDIETLTGCIPTEEQYGMQYKSTRLKEGELVFLGMEQKWQETRTETKYITGMHFRDATYPIKIRRYPGEGSMVTDSQRIGVIMGQFIRAQRLCSVLRTFKEAVQNVTLAAMRRGYKRREMDRVWGKFLVQWWKAEEVRRGELRSWYRKMTRVVTKEVQREMQGQQPEELKERRMCQHGGKCWYKNLFCPFAHTRVPPEWVPKAPTEDQPRKPTTQKQRVDPSEKGISGAEQIPKREGTIWKARGDGSCMFYCAAGCNSREEAFSLRHRVAQHVHDTWTETVNGSMRTDELLATFGWSKASYQESVVREDHLGDEWELAFLAKITRQRLRVFRDEEEHWQQFAEYGTEGPVCRLLFTPSSHCPHYDLIKVREAWEREGQEIELEREAVKQGTTTQQKRRKAEQTKRWTEEEEERRKKARQIVRKQKLWTSRAGVVDVDMDDADIHDLVTEPAEDNTTEEQMEVLVHTMRHNEPWEILGAQRTATEREATAAFRARSLLLHPDKCKHPRVVEAFQRLTDAHDWAKDRKDWEQRRLTREQLGVQRQLWNRWVLSGGEMRRAEGEEHLWRRTIEAEEDLNLLLLQEELGGIEHEETQEQMRHPGDAATRSDSVTHPGITRRKPQR